MLRIAEWGPPKTVVLKDTGFCGRLFHAEPQRTQRKPNILTTRKRVHNEFGNAPQNLFIVPRRGVVYNFNIATKKEAVVSSTGEAFCFLTKYKNEQREIIKMADDNKCAHPVCNCAVGDDAEYCSDHCKDAADQDIVEINCDCGHDACG